VIGDGRLVKRWLLARSVVTYENSRNPHEERRNWVQRVTSLAAQIQPVNKEIRQRAETLESKGIKALDALHLACAEMARCDYFITSDDRLIRKYQTLSEQELQTCNPTEFVRLVTGE
jgi:predicted nucleic acid-binding protein